MIILPIYYCTLYILPIYYCTLYILPIHYCTLYILPIYYLRLNYCSTTHTNQTISCHQTSVRGFLTGVAGLCQSFVVALEFQDIVLYCLYVVFCLSSYCQEFLSFWVIYSLISYLAGFFMVLYDFVTYLAL